MQDLINQADRGYFLKNETWVSLSIGEWLFRKIFSWLPGVESVSLKCFRISLKTLLDKTEAPTRSFIASIEFNNPLVIKTLILVDALKNRYIKTVEWELAKKDQGTNPGLLSEVDRLKEQLQKKENQLDQLKVHREQAGKECTLQNIHLEKQLKRKGEECQSNITLMNSQATQISDLINELDRTKNEFENLDKQVTLLRLLQKEGEQLSNQKQQLEQTIQELKQQLAELNQRSKIIPAIVNPPSLKEVQIKPVPMGNPRSEEIRLWQTKFERIKSDTPIPKELEGIVKIIKVSDYFPFVIAGCKNGGPLKKYSEQELFWTIESYVLYARLKIEEAMHNACVFSSCKQDYCLIFANPKEERVQSFLNWMEREYGMLSENYFQCVHSRYADNVQGKLTGSGKDQKRSHVQLYRYDINDGEVVVASDRWRPYPERPGGEISFMRERCDPVTIKKWQERPCGGLMFTEELKKVVVDGLKESFINASDYN